LREPPWRLWRSQRCDEVKPEESSKPVKFEKEGEFKYHCKIHGKSMSGTVIVKPLQ
jgi:plastocyanin